VEQTDTLIIQGISKYDRKKIPSGSIYSYANQRLSAKDFADYLEKRSNMVITRNPQYYIDTSVESILSDDLLNYEKSVLEKKYPDFKYLMLEFHDGILLFDISSDKVWNRVQEDSAGLYGFYEQIKKNYLSEKSVSGNIYTLRESGGDKKLTSAYKKYSRKGDPDAKMLQKFNGKGDTLLTITRGKWFKGDDPDIDNITWSTGIHSFRKDGYPSIIDIKKVNSPEPLPFNEIQAEVISGYQDWLTGEWIRQLKESYTVKVDNLVFEEVKKIIGNE